MPGGLEPGPPRTPQRMPRPTLPGEDRPQLRQAFRSLRRSIGAAERRAASAALARLLSANGLLRSGRRIALYLAHDGELDPGHVARFARPRGARLFVPVVTHAGMGRMRFAPLDSPARAWRRNRYGIREPGGVPRLWRGAKLLDVVLMPLVAFDAAGNRLGMGGGYYDRALAFRSLRRHWHRPLLIGLAYDCQEASTLSTARWDIPVDLIATPTRLLRIRPPNREAP